MVEAGQSAPEFEATDQEQRTVRLADFRGRPLVLYFYPRASTPGCTVEARGFRDLYAELQRRGAAVVGVSPDTVRAQKKFCDHERLPFPLLADHDRELARRYGVLQEKSLYGRLFLGVARTTFLIGPDGVVRRVFAKVKVKEHARQVLDALATLGGGPEVP